jgi:hypothetical protein
MQLLVILINFMHYENCILNFRNASQNVSVIILLGYLPHRGTINIYRIWSRNLMEEDMKWSVNE